MLEYSMLYPKSTVSRRAVSMDGMWKFRMSIMKKSVSVPWR